MPSRQNAVQYSLWHADHHGTVRKGLVKAAVDEAHQAAGWAMNVAVVDPNGDLVAFGRMDGAQLASVPISSIRAGRGADTAVDARLRGRRAKSRLQLHPHPDGRQSLRAAAFRWSTAARSLARSAFGATGSQDEATCTAAASTINTVVHDQQQTRRRGRPPGPVLVASGGHGWWLRCRGENHVVLNLARHDRGRGLDLNGKRSQISPLRLFFCRFSAAVGSIVCPSRRSRPC